MSHRRRDVPGGLGLSLGLRVGGPLLGGDAVGDAFSWYPVDGQPLPGVGTFTRNSDAWFHNGTVWVKVGVDVIRDAHFPLSTEVKGFLREQADTQLLPTLAIRDFTDVAWIATNITAVQDAVGIDGVANAASTLTATAANGTIFLPTTEVSDVHTYTVFARRKTGTGTVEITIDGGASYLDITSSLTTGTIAAQRFERRATLANPSVGFRLGTSGDEIEVDFANLVQREHKSSPIDIAGTRVQDILQLTDNWPPESSAIVDATAGSAIETSGTTRMLLLGFGSSGAAYFAVNGPARIRLSNGVTPQADASTSYLDERHTWGMSVKLNEGIVVDDEDNDATDLTGTPVGGVIFIGSSPGSGGGSPVVIHKVDIFSKTQTVDELKAKT